jgi:ABC-2 type transport system permease protein
MTSPVTAGSPTGSIYDLGYRGYEGPRLGRAFAIRSLFTHSLRSTYGLGRTTRAKLAPWFLLVFAVLPAISIIAALVLVGRFGGQISDIIGANSPIRYDTMFSVLSGAAILALFCAAQAPELFGRDQRFGILSLYFARALRRTDYTLARMLGFAMAVLILYLLPQLVLFLGRVLLATDVVAAFQRDVPSIPPVIAEGILAALLYGGLSMVVSAYTPRRAYAVAGIIALFTIPGIITGIVTGLGSSTAGDLLTLISPGFILERTNALLFGVSGDFDTTFVSLPDWAYFAAVIVGIVGSFAICIRRFQTISV